MIWVEGAPRIQYRTRDASALFAAAEWGWSFEPGEAYVFDAYDAGKDRTTGEPIGTPEGDAWQHIAAMSPEDREHSIGVVAGVSAEVEAERERRHAERLAGSGASTRRTSPEETYRETARRLGERDDS